IELAWCYWRVGAYDEARVLLRETREEPNTLKDELLLVALLRSAEVERADGRLSDALAILAQAGALIETCGNDALTGIFHGTRARALLAEGRIVEAEKTAHAAVRALEGVDELALLTEALTTHGTTLARLGQMTGARAALERALQTGDRAGAGESVGRAALAMS